MTDTDTYLSHPVRRMREDPVPGEEATLIVDVADAGSVDDPAVGAVETAATRSPGAGDAGEDVRPDG